MKKAISYIRARRHGETNPLRRAGIRVTSSAQASAPQMLRIRRILVPFDFSPGSSLAARYATALARQCRAKITLLHVRPVPYFPAELGGIPSVAPLNEPSAALVQERLKSHTERLIPAEMRTRSLVRIGPAFDEVCHAAHEIKSDLIVISTHGYKGLKHILLGSTAERVVRHAPCPVLVVRETKRHRG